MFTFCVTSSFSEVNRRKEGTSDKVGTVDAQDKNHAVDNDQDPVQPILGCPSHIVEILDAFIVQGILISLDGKGLDFICGGVNNQKGHMEETSNMLIVCKAFTSTFKTDS